ncbi:MAG: endonuclease domain-containing protein [Candidatus Thiodiazotropha sp. (ex. Lucinisca nassula)]|nr:endonuclease domain-containing protein [Candidatus Thiodiazotropha sp. (ex. Lucinisca nassula)]
MNKRIFAKRLRQNMTEAERVLWKQLRAHRLSDQKFRRQQPIGPYIVDFVNFGANLIIECDGGQHNQSATDRKRDAWLNQQGFQVLRFWNHDILNNTESVLTEILTLLPPSPAAGEGPGERGNQQEKE